MKELKVISKLFNQKDVLEVEGDKLAFKISVSNIETLTDAQLSELKVGDVVQKITGNQKHCYIVTYKEENHGICLSYFDAGYLETVSYDYTDGHWVFNSKDVCEVASKNSTLPVLRPTGTETLAESNIEELYNKYVLIDYSNMFVIGKFYVDSELNIVNFYGFASESGDLYMATSNDIYIDITWSDFMLYIFDSTNRYMTSEEIEEAVAGAGGTKLYKHSISGLPSLFGGTFVVISNSEGAVTNVSQLYLLINQGLNAYYQGPTSGKVFMCIMDPAQSKYYLIYSADAEPMFSTFSLSSYEITGSTITDTVTPL